MKSVVKFAQSVVTAIALMCFIFIGGFVYLAYTSPDKIAEVVCAFSTDGSVTDYEACVTTTTS